MSEKQTIVLKEGTEELVIRHGDAQKIKYPQVVERVGTIYSPANYRSIRENEFDAKKAFVSYNYRGGRIVLEIDPKDEDETTITGQLTENPLISELGINTKRVYGLNDLVSVLKMNRVLFPDKDQHAALLTNLSKFKAKVQREIEEHKDDRGNKRSLNDIQVTSDVPLDFNLNFPLFVGEKESKFKVTVCFDIRDGGVSVWLESIELKELLDGMKKGIIDGQLAKFKDLVCIETI